MFHFAYGSNPSSKFPRSHCPSARFVMKAYLPNFSVAFLFYSERRKGGISIIIPDPGKLVGDHEEAAPIPQVKAVQPLS